MCVVQCYCCMCCAFDLAGLIQDKNTICVFHVIPTKKTNHRSIQSAPCCSRFSTSCTSLSSPRRGRGPARVPRRAMINCSVDCRA
jgi:hypothetical protein